MPHPYPTGLGWGKDGVIDNFLPQKYFRGVGRLTLTIYGSIRRTTFTASCYVLTVGMAIAYVSLQTGLLLVCICSTLQLGTVMADKRTVLVSMEGRNRVVDFCGQAGTDRSALTAAVKIAFSDVLCGQEFFLQIKDEEWGGAFVELT